MLLSKERELNVFFSVQSILGADSVNFDAFNVTVFEQISNSYQKLSETIVQPPVDLQDIAAETEQHLKQEQGDHTDEHEHEEGEGEEDFSDHQPPPPTVC